MTQPAVGDERLNALVEFAGLLADEARRVTTKYFRTPVAAEIKPDASPVSIADREVEAVIRSMIEEAYPDHGIFGEEEAPVRIDARYVWVVDPIDGTKSFLIGKPLFGTLIGLLRDGNPVAGIIDHPALDERWTGARGRATTFNGAPVLSRRCVDISQAWLTATSPAMFKETQIDAFNRLAGACRYVRWGADCMGYGLLASGFLDVVCEATMDPHDYLAVVAVVEGAGGMVTDWTGGPLGLEGDGTVLACGDPALHKLVLKILNG